MEPCQRCAGGAVEYAWKVWGTRFSLLSCSYYLSPRSSLPIEPLIWELYWLHRVQDIKFNGLFCQAHNRRGSFSTLQSQFLYFLLYSLTSTTHLWNVLLTFYFLLKMKNINSCSLPWTLFGVEDSSLRLSRYYNTDILKSSHILCFWCFHITFRLR